MCIMMMILLFASCGNDKQAETVTANDYFTSSDLDIGYDEADATNITLNVDSIQVDGDGAKVSGTTVTLTQDLTYIITGTLDDGQIIVDASSSDKLHIVLNGVDITCSDNPAIYIKQADKVFITLAEDTQNTLSDGSSYATDSDETNLDAAIYSKDDLTLNGNGTLTVNGNYAHAIVSKDDLVIGSGTYIITSVNTALYGKDCVKINEGTFTITAGTDGIKSDNDEDETLGYVVICGGTFTITAGKDGIQATTDILIGGGTFDITTGGGSSDASTTSSGTQNSQWGTNWGTGQNQNQTSSSSSDTASAKGLKAGVDLTIEGAVLTIDSSDDGVHSNGNVYLTDVSLTIASGDDGIHADSLVQVNGTSTIEISKSYEGIEGLSIEINGGDISVTASDDGFNAAGGNDSSSLNGRLGMNSFSSDSDCVITINDGYVFINASGDGIDSNGSVEINGGVTLVSGPTDSSNGALDYNSTAEITGGIFIAAGSSGMMQNFEQADQGALLCFSTSTISGGTSVIIVDKDGNVVASFTPPKNYQCVLFSAPAISSGQTYTIYTGATVSGADENGYAVSTSFSGGTKLASVTLSKNIMSYGSSGNSFH
jgi:hypothetical protein